VNIPALTIFENDGSGIFLPVTYSFAGKEKKVETMSIDALSHWDRIKAADIDGDGDIDIIVSSFTSARCYVAENSSE
jgi:hypothetical protein